MATMQPQETLVELLSAGIKVETAGEELYDQMYHRMTAYSTRKRAAATADLFDAA